MPTVPHRPGARSHHPGVRGRVGATEAATVRGTPGPVPRRQRPRVQLHRVRAPTTTINLVHRHARSGHQPAAFTPRVCLSTGATPAANIDAHPARIGGAVGSADGALLSKLAGLKG